MFRIFNILFILTLDSFYACLLTWLSNRLEIESSWCIYSSLSSRPTDIAVTIINYRYTLPNALLDCEVVAVGYLRYIRWWSVYCSTGMRNTCQNRLRIGIGVDIDVRTSEQVRHVLDQLLIIGYESYFSDLLIAWLASFTQFRYV